MLGEFFNAEVSTVAYSGITVSCPSTQGGRTIRDFYDSISAFNKTKYDFSKFQADVVFVNLGSNDASSSRLNDEDMYTGYYDLLKKIRENLMLILFVYMETLAQMK